MPRIRTRAVLNDGFLCAACVNDCHVAAAAYCHDRQHDVFWSGAHLFAARASETVVDLRGKAHAYREPLKNAVSTDLNFAARRRDNCDRATACTSVLLPRFASSPACGLPALARHAVISQRGAFLNQKLRVQRQSHRKP